MIKHATTPKEGFTLVETLVAIAILLVTIMGPFYSLQQAIMSAYLSRDKLIAGALAQEGVEYSRVMRDNNYHTSMPWLAGMDGTPDDGNLHSADCITKLCMVDSTQDTISDFPVGTAGQAPLNLSSSNIYTYGAGTPTKFYRTVRLTTINADDARVTVTVAWRNSVATTTIMVNSELYNWQ